MFLGVNGAKPCKTWVSLSARQAKVRTPLSRSVSSSGRFVTFHVKSDRVRPPIDAHGAAERRVAVGLSGVRGAAAGDQHGSQPREPHFTAYETDKPRPGPLPLGLPPLRQMCCWNAKVVLVPSRDASTRSTQRRGLFGGGHRPPGRRSGFGRRDRQEVWLDPPPRGLRGDFEGSRLAFFRNLPFRRGAESRPPHGYRSAFAGRRRQAGGAPVAQQLDAGSAGGLNFSKLKVFIRLRGRGGDARRQLGA